MTPPAGGPARDDKEGGDDAERAQGGGGVDPGASAQAGAAADAVLDDVLVLALIDRVWQSGEAWGRAGLLAEEAAVEVGRWALGRLAGPPT